MLSNIEIKARANDFSKQKKIAASISDYPGKVILQRDIFYATPKGRLKLRVFNNDSGELIYYERDDQEGPKRSNYEISKTKEPEKLNKVLTASFGVLGEVKKKRILFITEKTRIHLDVVERLGQFIELEFVMDEKTMIDEAEETVNRLIEKLEINQNDLIDRAYIDLIVALSNSTGR